jgi:uncharacterized protein YdeI (YjbR/CyaY-like superfamily)
VLGWIDGIRKSFDERSFLQRYTPRGRKSRWSQINCKRVESLVAAGRMTPRGQRQVDAREKKTFRTLNKMNLFALAFRTNAMKTTAGRAKKIAALVAMLARSETIVPNQPIPKAKKAAASRNGQRRKAHRARKK